MSSAVKKVMILPERSTLLGIADEAVAKRLAREVEHFAGAGSIAIASSLPQLHLLSSRVGPKVILLDYELLCGAPLSESVRQLRVAAPVILLAPVDQQAAAARLVAAGDVEFVARAGDFIPLVACLIERKLQWAEMSKSVLGSSWTEFGSDIGSIFRHEINNPLTGILGNAELLLAHRDRLTSVDTQRLQTVVDLAVRLRETIRRLSDAWENQPHSVKSD
jgi:signal transduction histidine kinase